MAFVVVALFLVLGPVRGLLVEMEGSTFLVEYLVIFDGDLTSSAEDSPSEVPSAVEDLLFGEDSLLLEVDLTSVEVLLMVEDALPEDSSFAVEHSLPSAKDSSSAVEDSSYSSSIVLTPQAESLFLPHSFVISP